MTRGEGPDELKLLENMTVETEGEKIAIKFSAPKATLQTVIQNQLERLPE